MQEILGGVDGVGHLGGNDTGLHELVLSIYEVLDPIFSLGSGHLLSIDSDSTLGGPHVIQVFGALHDVRKISILEDL